MDQNNLINITEHNDISVVSFGISSISSVSKVEQIGSKIHEFIAQSRPKKLIVDFDGVRFFSSQMLGLLVDIWRKLTEYKGVIMIAGINPHLSRVFRITNLDKLFEFYPDAKTAVKALTDDIPDANQTTLQ